MKKFLLSILLLSVIVPAAISILSGFRSPGPEFIVNNYLEAIKAQNDEEIQKYYNINIMEGIESGGVSVDLNAFNIEGRAEAKKLLSDFEYTVSEQKVSEKEATIEVEIGTYDTGKIGETWINHCFKQIDLWSQKGGELNVRALMEDTYIKMLQGADKEYSLKYTFTLKKGEDGWEIDKIS